MLTSEMFARIMLECKAVMLSPSKPFTFASGIQSPIYCDNRMLLGLPQERTAIAETISSMVTHMAHNANDTSCTVDAIVGTATAGIPWATLCADTLQLPMAYVRLAAKHHGTKKTIEGANLTGKRIIIIEDLISTGTSVFQTARECIANGAVVLGIVALFSYEMNTLYNEINNTPTIVNYPITPMSTLSTLLTTAKTLGYITEVERQHIIAWRDEQIQKHTIDT